MKNKIIIGILTIGLIIGFIGCGGGSTDSPIPSVKYIGTFVDSPVQGLQYETATLSGTTDSQGKFYYMTGETVTFKIGNLILGNVKGEYIISPLTLAGDSDMNSISTRATNIARILQTLDENPLNNSLLKLSNSLQDLNISNINLESDADLNTILTSAQSITSKTYTLKDIDSSKKHMKTYVNLFKNYQVIQKNTLYRGTGTKYYILQIVEKQDIKLFDHLWDNSTYGEGLTESWNNATQFTILNTTMKFLKTIKGGTFVTFEPGIYVIEFEHGTRKGGRKLEMKSRLL